MDMNRLRVNSDPYSTPSAAAAAADGHEMRGGTRVESLHIAQGLRAICRFPEAMIQTFPCIARSKGYLALPHATLSSCKQ